MMLPIEILELIFVYSSDETQLVLSKVDPIFFSLYDKTLIRDVRRRFDIKDHMRHCRAWGYNFTIKEEDYKYLFRVYSMLYLYKDKKLMYVDIDGSDWGKLVYIGTFEEEQLSRMSFNKERAYAIIDEKLYIYKEYELTKFRINLKDKVIGFTKNMVVITDTGKKYRIMDLPISYIATLKCT